MDQDPSGLKKDEMSRQPVDHHADSFKLAGPEEQKTQQASKPSWGFLATAGFGILVWAVFLAVQLFIAGWFIAAEVERAPDAEMEVIASRLDQNGLLVSLATMATAVLCSCLVFLLIKLRRGPSVTRYLCFLPVSPRVLLRWLGLTLLFILASDTTTHLLGKPIVHEFMVQAYRTAVFAPLFWVTIIVAAPMFEEIFFRGFLFQGFQHSRFGIMGAVLITSFAWAVIHSQYGVYEHATIFLGGILLGLARVRTGSLFTVMAMHALFNLVAVVQVVVCLHLGSCGG